MEKIEGIFDNNVLQDITVELKGNIYKDSDSETDEEYCKKMYKKYKEEMFKYIKGEYVLVLRDGDKIILARDKIGIEQLYYSINKRKLYYSTEFKFFLKNANFKKIIRKDILQQFLTYTYIAAPDTILKNIYKLEPGSMVIFKKNKIKKVKYYDLVNTYKELSQNQEQDFTQCKQNIINTIENIIKSNIQKDKTYGSFLSGGIDSTLITAVANKYCEKTIQTFSIGFYDKEFDEAQYAKEIAKYLGCSYNEIYINQKMVLDAIKKIPYIYDEPFADGSQIPTIILNEFAKKKCIDTVFTGDGADQIFYGSTLYDNIDKKIEENKIKNYSRKVQFDAYIRERRIRWYMTKGRKSKIYNVDYYKIKNNKISRMLLETQKFLPDRLLCKVLKPSSYNGIRLIKPFSTTDIVEESYKIPEKYKYFNGEKKYILKEIVYDYVPKKYLDREKHGFSIPIKKWLLEEPFYSELLRVSDEKFLKKQHIFDSKKIKEYIEIFKEKRKKGDAIVLWCFYVFQIWYETYMR